MHTVLFDLDGTLLPMDMEAFLRAYLQELSKRAPLQVTILWSSWR